MENDIKKEKKDINSSLTVHAGHRDRMKQRLIDGDLDSYQTHEIVEMMLYQTNKACDTNGIAHGLLKKFGSLSGVLNADVKELMTVKGVGKNTATTIKNYLAVFRRYKKEMLQNKKRLATFQQVLDYAFILLAEGPNEEFVVVCLDNGYNIINVKTWQGSVNKVSLLVREVVGFCFNSKAVGVVIAHSHPNGYPSPSSNDLLFTNLLYAALKSIDVTLAEHIIIGKDKYFSFYKSGFLEKYKKTYATHYDPQAIAVDKFALEGDYITTDDRRDL